MKIKLNAWRLARETRLVDGVPAINVLTLRDPHGKVIRTARTRSEEKELEAWWKAHERKIRIEDLPVSKALRKRLRSAVVRLKKRGFKYRMSFVGVRLNPESGGWEYCRWEVYKATKWSKTEYLRMNAIFEGRYVKEPFGLFHITWKDGHDKLLRYRLTPRKK
jgi:hypothetical protein